MADQAYLSFIEQTIHYFDRPHEQAVAHAIDCAAAWRGSELPSLEDMVYQLSDQEIDEVLAAVSAAVETGRPTKELTAQDFPLPLLAPRIVEWRTLLADGLGFTVIYGF